MNARVAMMACLFVLLPLSVLFASACGQSFSVQEPLEALENGSLSIFCLTFPDGPVAAAIVLREDGVRPVSRVSDGATRVATYREFILSDIVREDNGREFTCSASEVITAPAQLTVFYVDAFVLSTDPNGNLTLAEGASFTISYSITVNPMAPAQLLREDGAAIDSARVMLTDSAVVISNVQRSDAGAYVLKVTSQGTSLSVNTSTSIDLVVEYGPIFDVMSVDARCEMENLQAVTCYVMLGSDINIDCTFESFPEAVGEIGELEARLNTSNVEVEDTSIIIEGVTEENLGVYRCMASNEVAGQQVTRTITIEVANGELATSTSTTVSITDSASVTTSGLFSIFIMLVVIIIQ